MVDLEKTASKMALRAPSLQSLLESDRGSNDSLLTESLQLDINEVTQYWQLNFQ